MTAPATRNLVTSAVWVMSIHGLSRKHLLKGKRLPTTRVHGSLKNTLTTEKTTYDEAFSRVDEQGAGLKEIEANARVVVEVRNPALLWERRADGEASRGRRTREEKFAASSRKPRGSRSKSSTAQHIRSNSS